MVGLAASLIYPLSKGKTETNKQTGARAVGFVEEIHTNGKQFALGLRSLGTPGHI